MDKRRQGSQPIEQSEFAEWLRAAYPQASAPQPRVHDFQKFARYWADLGASEAMRARSRSPRQQTFPHAAPAPSNRTAAKPASTNASSMTASPTNDDPGGQGILKLPGGGEYRGQTQGGKPHGLGMETKPDGTEYIGEWRFGEKHGRGVQIKPDGTRLQCEWAGGKPHGHGVLTEPSGDTYAGQFREGRVHGYGVQEWLDGDGRERQEGQWENDVAHCYGVHAWPDGSGYEGHFENDDEQGYGRRMGPFCGVEYEGQWDHGCRHGYGEGEWNGELQAGIWEKGRFVGN